MMLDQFSAYQQRIDDCLTDNLDHVDAPAVLLQAMRYGVFNGGKRIRPTLTYLAAEVLSVPLDQVDQIAAAIEFMHAYSLIHDDLPAMDDDDLRRGQPSCHIKFDEATAILAGDALQALAFDIVARDENLSSAVRVLLLAELARASGASGMVGGQAIDLASEQHTIKGHLLETMHQKKTGELIALSVRAAAVINGNDPETVAAMSDFGFTLGLAFQVRDDILDVTGNQTEIGKPIGSDVASEKSTFVSLYGLQEAKSRLETLAQQAEQALAPFGNNAAKLLAMTQFIVSRNY